MLDMVFYLGVIAIKISGFLKVLGGAGVLALVCCGVSYAAARIEYQGFPLKENIRASFMGYKTEEVEVVTVDGHIAEDIHCNMNVYRRNDAGNELSLLAINGQSCGVVDIIQLDQNGKPSGHAVYTSFGSFGDEESGNSLVYITNGFRGYGTFDAVITFNRERPPLLTDCLAQLTCEPCQDAIQRFRPDPGADILLIDPIGQDYYRLDHKRCSFLIRDRYEVSMLPVNDQEVKLHILDRKITEISKEKEG